VALHAVVSMHGSKVGEFAAYEKLHELQDGVGYEQCACRTSHELELVRHVIPSGFLMIQMHLGFTQCYFA